MNNNDSLGVAKKQKNDEFYTQLSDIENELCHYKEYFKGKVVFCNCDDPYESNFFKYFVLNFNAFDLKKLIATGYTTSPIVGKELSLFENEANVSKNQPYAVYINEVADLNGDGCTDLEDVKILLKMKKNTRRKLYGDNEYPAGDFRSKESIALLKQADIVVTNPPFSIAREYVKQLMDYKKKFLIIGDLNWVTYKEIFPLLKNNLVWIGYNSIKQFIQTDRSFKKFGNKLWFTNLDIEKHHEDLIVWKKYNPQDYPKYDNYDAINVDKVQDIPCDYNGIMGVPITFLDNYNPNQFEIIGMAHGNMGYALGVSANFTEEMCNYYSKKNKAFRKGLVCYTTLDDKLVVPYMRILIKRKGRFIRGKI